MRFHMSYIQHNGGRANACIWRFENRLGFFLFTLLLWIAVVPASAAPIEVTFQGKVLDADNMNDPIGGVRPVASLIRQIAGTKRVFRQGVLGPTAAMGDYDTPVMGQHPLPAGATVDWRVRVSEFRKEGMKMFVRNGNPPFLPGPNGGLFFHNVFRRVNTFFKGFEQGNVVLDDMGKATVMVPDIIARETLSPVTFSQLGNQEPIGVNVDPSYSFTPIDPVNSTGTLSIANTFDPSLVDEIIQGYVKYLDGTIVSENVSGDETIFNQLLAFADIDVLGRNPDGSFIFGDGHIQIGDSSSGIYLDADIVNIFATDDGPDPVFTGLLSINQIGSALLNSRFLDEVRDVQLSGGLVSIGFDPTIVTATNGFTMSATVEGAAGVFASVPEPSTFLLGCLAFFGVIGATVVRRRSVGRPTDMVR